MAHLEDKAFIIIADTRDKDGYRWTFSSFDDKEFSGVEVKKLDVGDYSIVGLETVFAVERKKSLSELINNISSKDKGRFNRELDKLSKYKYPYIICEFTIEDLLRGTRFSQVSPFYVLSILLEIESSLGINVHFAGNKAELLCYRIIRKVWMLENGFKRWI